MEKSSPSLVSAPRLHQAIIQTKNDHDLLNVLKEYISAVGGFGNAPMEMFERLR